VNGRAYHSFVTSYVYFGGGIHVMVEEVEEVDGVEGV
jgi:hypothetical protein